MPHRNNPLKTQGDIPQGYAAPFPIAVDGVDNGLSGLKGMEQVLLDVMNNPEFEGATEGLMRAETRVRKVIIDGVEHIQILGYNLCSFEPDEATAAREAFQIVRSSELGRAAENAPADAVQQAAGSLKGVISLCSHRARRTAAPLLLLFAVGVCLAQYALAG